jgi:hydroxypyruvate isomerase
VLFNGPPGDWDGGERGTASLPGRDAEFRDGIAKAIDYAVALDCPRIHVMAGLVPQQLPQRDAVQPCTWTTCAGPPPRPRRQGATC